MVLLTQEEIIEIELIEKTLSREGHKQLVYSKGYYDKDFFSDYFLHDWKINEKTGEFIESPDFHKEIWDMLDKGIDLNIVIARGHGKTTSILIWITHALLYKTEKSILYVAFEKLGKKGVGRIKEALESNPLIIEVFGQMKPSKIYKKDGDTGSRWTLSLIELSNGTSLETKSSGQSIRGDRPTKILFDDPQDNKDVKNKRLVAEFNIWVFSTLYNTLMPGGSMCALGTIIGNLCLVKYLRDVKKWYTIEYEACDENFKNVLWPDMWSEESLRIRRDGLELPDGTFQLGIGTPLFNQEFRHIPLTKENSMIQEHWIRYWALLPEKFDKIVMAIDPADGEKETGDFIGICVVGFHGSNRYVLHCKGYKESSLEIPKIARSLFEKYQSNVIIFEKNKEASIGKIMKQEGLPIHMHHAHKDKTTRLLGVQPMLEAGKVFFANTGEHQSVIDQLTNFPETENDDEMDALIYCLSSEFNSSGGVFVI